MFDEKQINAYRNIKAPDGILDKIKKSQRRSVSPLYMICTVAACFIVMVVGFAYNNKSNIVINGQQLKDTVVFYDTSAARNMTASSEISIPVEIEVSQSTKISVLQGVISVDGSKASKETVINSPTTVWWEIKPTETNNVFEMKISDKNGAQKVTLEYNDAKITATKEKEK